jgi:hypothetical protein
VLSSGIEGRASTRLFSTSRLLGLYGHLYGFAVTQQLDWVPIKHACSGPYGSRINGASDSEATQTSEKAHGGVDGSGGSCHTTSQSHGAGMVSARRR